jgi:hypothetical protein
LWLHAARRARTTPCRRIWVPLLTTDSNGTWVPRSVRSSRGYGWLSLWPLLHAVARPSGLPDGAQAVLLCEFWMLSHQPSLERWVWVPARGSSSRGYGCRAIAGPRRTPTASAPLRNRSITQQTATDESLQAVVRTSANMFGSALCSELVLSECPSGMISGLLRDTPESNGAFPGLIHAVHVPVGV